MAVICSVPMSCFNRKSVSAEKKTLHPVVFSIHTFRRCFNFLTHVWFVYADDFAVGQPVYPKAWLQVSEWWRSHHVGETRRADGPHSRYAQISIQETKVLIQPQIEHISIFLSFFRLKQFEAVCSASQNTFILVVDQWMRSRTCITSREPVSHVRCSSRIGREPTLITLDRVSTGRVQQLWVSWKQCSLGNGELEFCTGSKLKLEPGPYPRSSDPTRPERHS